MKFIITFQAIQNYIPDTDGNQLPNTIDNSLKIFNAFENDVASLPISMFDVTTTNGKLTLNLKAGVTYPETLVLPTQDEEGNAITHLSSTFASNTSIKKIVVPSTYTSMDADCFLDNKTIQSVDLSQSNITVIPNGSFNRSSLQSVKLPDTLQKISNSAFYNSSLTSIIIPDGVKEISVGALYLTKLASIYIPASVEIIEPVAIHSSTLRKIVVDDDNKFFYDLDNVMLNSYDGRLIYKAYENAESQIVIPEGIKTIDRLSLYNRYANIYEVVFSSTVMYIEDGALPSGMISCVIDENNTYLSSPTGNELLDYRKHLVWYNKLSENISYSIPDNVVRISQYGMSSNNYLQVLYIPASVTYITADGIGSCNNLQSIIFVSSTPPGMYGNASINLTNVNIYVPDSAVETYKALANLANYKDRIYPVSQFNS